MNGIEQLLIDHNIPTSTSGSDWQPGWINIQCPFCDDQKAHGGFNIKGGYYNCWKCGGKSNPKVVSHLLSINYYEAVKLLEQYGTGSNSEHKQIKKKAEAEKIIWPANCHDLNHAHKKYLWARNFDPTKMVELWGIRGTGPIGPYKFRIIVPIYHNGKLVSYQGRDITNRADLRYKACPVEKEVIHHKHIVYGLDHVTNGRAIIVEGVFDVWRLGYGAVSTFGTEVTNEQCILLAERLKEAYICFDDENAEDKASSLANRLVALGVSVDLIEIDADDPAELSDMEAAKMMKLVK